MSFMGLLGGTVIKNSLVKAGDTGGKGLIFESGKSPIVGNSNPFQYSCLENSMNREAWWIRCHKQLDMTEHADACHLSASSMALINLFHIKRAYLLLGESLLQKIIKNPQDQKRNKSHKNIIMQSILTCSHLKSNQQKYHKNVRMDSFVDPLGKP